MQRKEQIFLIPAGANVGTIGYDAEMKTITVSRRHFLAVAAATPWAFQSLAANFPQDPAADGNNQAALFGNRNEPGWRN